MKVVKFGGASIDSVNRIRNIEMLLQGYRTEKLIRIVSA